MPETFKVKKYHQMKAKIVYLLDKKNSACPNGSFWYNCEAFVL
jgi:hypothetical protein